MSRLCVARQPPPGLNNPQLPPASASGGMRGAGPGPRPFWVRRFEPRLCRDPHPRRGKPEFPQKKPRENQAPWVCCGPGRGGGRRCCRAAGRKAEDVVPLPTGAGSAGAASLVRTRCLPGGHSHLSPLSDPRPPCLSFSRRAMPLRSFGRWTPMVLWQVVPCGRRQLPFLLLSLLILPSSFFIFFFSFYLSLFFFFFPPFFPSLLCCQLFLCPGANL